MGDIGRDHLRDQARRRIFREYVPGPRSRAGLEIGALCNPLFRKDEADVRFYDIAPKEELVESFSRYYPGRAFVDVDFVARDRPMDAVLGSLRFDYIIANHVVEHIPDFIGFFDDLHRHLNDGGRCFLAIPDRRFTFDSHRAETTAGHLIVDHEDGAPVDAAEHILDALIYHAEQPKVYWDEIQAQRYRFVHHHHVFNHADFLDRIIKPLIRLRYFSFSVVACIREPELDDEFVLVLKKPQDPGLLEVLGEPVPRQPAARMPSRPRGDPREQMALIERSSWFDPDWYVKTYPSVKESGMGPLEHYYSRGGFEGLDPSERFDSDFYLEENPDVRQAGFNPLWHFLRHGIEEGRKPR